MLPGMERKLTEHMMVHHYTATASEASARSLQEVPLLKGSFGHHSSSLGHGVAASSSQESLYGSQHHHQPGVSGGGPPILASDSLYSLRGQHHSSQRSSALVTAEIVPVVPGHQRLSIELVSSDEVPVGAMGIMSSSVSSGAITSSSFMPTTSMGASATLPRNLENGFAGGGQQPQPNSHHAAAAASMRLHSVNSRLTSSPILVDTHVRTATNSMAMTTMPRTGTNGLMHHQSNGNGGPPPSNWPPTASPPSSTS